MDRTLSRERENQCVQEQPPACTAGCPLHVNARAMIAAAAKHDFASGLALLMRTIPFPHIVSRICEQPCQTACKRNVAGGAIEIRSLEQACLKYSDKAPKKSILPPKKTKKVAIVGGSLSGLTAAYDLAQKGYPVVIYESGEVLGGGIWRYDEAQLPRYLIEKDFSVLFQLGVEVSWDSLIAATGTLSCDDLLQEYDAVYLGVSLQKCNVDQVSIDPITLATDRAKLFGGAKVSELQIGKILHGRIAAISIDRYLQGASMTAGREQLGSCETHLYTDMSEIAPLPPVLPSDSADGYSQAEAVAEAQRCLQCQCLECVKNCEYLAYYGGYPKKYIREIYNNDSIVMGIHYANKMINSCALCGLCQSVCPNDLNMGEVCLEARQRMVDKGKMPLSVHDFALRDMAFSTSEHYTLVRHQPGFKQSRYLFFPGCQLSASSPDHVVKTYEFLREQLTGGVGIMLNCCGAPAYWAGRQELFEKNLDIVEEQWKNCGFPTLIAACSTCCQMFHTHRSNMVVESLWTVMDKLELPPPVNLESGRTVCVVDPCTARSEILVQESVRNLLEKLEVRVEETASSRGQTSCCGYGGLMSFANPELATKVVQRRSSESPADYIAYCAMCRDNFVASGKRTFHMLDLIWGLENQEPCRAAPDYSSRRENRVRVKNRLLREVWKEMGPEEQDQIQVEISDTVRGLMEQRMILVDDVRQVIAHAQASGETLLNQETGRQIAHYRTGYVTYWVEYSATQSGFAVHNAYSHRMVVEENGS